MKNIGDLPISFEAKSIGDLSICFKESVDCNARKMGQIIRIVIKISNKTVL